MLVKRIKVDNFMKARIFLGLWVAFAAGFISLRADDTPAQATARAALEQKLNDLDTPQTQPAPGTPSGAVVVQPGESATNVTDTVPAKAVVLQTAPAAITLVAAPAAVAPVTVATAATARSAAAPTKKAPATPKPTPALAATKSSSSPAQVKPTNEIVTTDGTIYKNAQVEKVEPDGIIISYTLAGSGLAMTKVYFIELSAELRQRYEKE